jgi:hypothetical protein
MSDFNLSDKIMGGDGEHHEYWTPKEMIEGDDVKEFIRLLKEEIIRDFSISNPNGACRKIDKLAGEKLK